MRVQKVSDPVYAPNSKGGPAADPEHYPYVEKWEADGEFVHAAYTLRQDDDDWGQAGTLVREVMDDAQRDRLVSNVVGHLSNGVSRTTTGPRASVAIGVNGSSTGVYWRNASTRRSATASRRAAW
jgi:catalase